MKEGKLSNEQEKIVCRHCEKVVERDNPINPQLHINYGINVFNSMLECSMLLGLSVGVFSSLFICYRYYRDLHCGVHATEIWKLHCYRGYHVNLIVKRMSELKSKGLVVVFGTGPNHSILYAPSERVIKLLDERFGSIEVGDGD